MARKLSLQERESINYITDVLCHALPAAQRSFAGSLASALVRVKGDQVTDADLVRATEKFGEYQSALIEVAKAKVLDRVPAVDAKGDGEAFTLRVPESLGEAASEPEDAAAEASAAGEKPTEPSAEAAAEPAEKKPVRRRRTRRKKAAEPEGEAEVAKAVAEVEVTAVAEAEAAPAAELESQAENATEAVGPEPEPEAKKKSVRPGRGARAARAKAKAEAAEKAAEAKEDAKGKKAALPAAKEAPALPEAAAAAAESEAGAASAAEEATAEVAPEASSASAKEAPKKRTRRRRTKKPVEDIVVKGPEAEQLLAKEAAAVEVEAAGEAVAKEVATEEPPVAAETDAVANEPQAEALLAEKGDAAEVAPEVAEEPAAEPADVPAAEVTAEPAAEDHPNGRSGGRARVRGRGRRGLERRSRGDNLSDVPYVRRGGESETALREQIVQLDPRLWMNGWLLSHPGAFTLYERELRGIDAALQEGELPGDLTRRQLAYKMGGNEKFFEYGADGHKLLRAMGADDLIGHRLVPKADMLYHVPRRRKSMKILVTENLDPWLDVRDLMYEDGRSLILGERVHGVVLGGGNPVIENNRLSGLLETLGAETIEVLYWGDIDRAGLNLLQRLQAMLEGRYKVTPFMPAYRLMLERAMERYPDPDQNERTTQDNVEVQDFSSMLEGLSDEQAAYFSAIIQKCGLIPQEILTKQDL